jgi:NTP pyrophosphatase (non-canonical NTP hydrolase)
LQNFNDYQAFTKSKAVYNESVVLSAACYDDVDHPYVADMWLPYAYPAFALCEEAGEVAGKIAKFIRKSEGNGVTTEGIKQLRLDVAKELGDVMYQVSEVARQFNWNLQEIVDMNVEKLDDRQARGVLVGEGDNR